MFALNVFSAFDGAGIGLLALKQAGIPVANYYASEVDKYAMQIAKKNHPEIQHVGDIKSCYARNFPRIDLLIGGSPCQDLSIAKQNRQGLGGARSGLFWHYVRLLRTMKPKYFLLENVASMSKADRAKITEILGVEPVLINSALVSAQQRKRLYWTNIPNITQPEDKHIILQDILESGLADLKKGYTLCSTYYKGMGSNPLMYHTKHQKRPYVCEPMKLGGFYNQNTRWGIFSEQGKSPTLTAAMGMGGGFIPMVPEKIGEFGKGGQGCRVYSVHAKSACLSSARGGGYQQWVKLDLPDGDYTIRKLTPTECERLQTWPDGYTQGVSNTQRYKMLGNGWTADVIAHIFSFMRKQ